MSWRTTRWLRRTVQVASLLFFLVLAFGTLQRYGPRLPADAFFRFDPLTSFGAMIAGRQWLWHLSLALITVVVTVALGRVWCGWVCPMGTVLEYVRFKKARWRAKRLPPRLRLTKYVLLTMIVVGAALGSLTLMVLDPITLITRSTTTSVIPGIDYVVRSAEKVMAHIGWLQGALGWIDNTARGHGLPAVSPVFTQAVFLGLLFLGVIALNAFADRFWCRYLCPLGALLGLLSKVAPLRPLVGEACNSCSRCAGACRLGAVDQVAQQAGAGDAALDAPAASPARAYEVVTSECTMCLDCLVACEADSSMTIGWQPHAGPWREYDPGRRQLLTATAAGVGSVVLLGTGWWNKVRPAQLVRPPGVHDEGAFLSACVRCGACLDVCPTSGLQPALNEAGLAGLWTPTLKPRLGYCAWQCTSCGQVCPTDAIPRLHLSTKRRDVIGVATIDRGRCLPWSQGRSCTVCQEVCPVPMNAIHLSGGKLVTLPDGTADFVAYPKVRADRCVGCGICEFSCPVSGEAAIVVLPASTAPPPSKGGAAPAG